MKDLSQSQAAVSPAPTLTPEELQRIKELRSRTTFPEPDVSMFAAEKPSPKGGRPSLLTPDLVAAILHIVRSDGCSDSYAGLLNNVSPSTLSRWKRENEDFAFLMEQARAQFEVARLRNIGRTATRDGQLNWRAQAWLLQQSSPETYGPPSRPRQAKATEEVRAENTEPLEKRLVLSPEDLRILQERRRAALEKMHAEEPATEAPQQNATNLAETSPHPVAEPTPAPVAAVYDRRAQDMDVPSGASPTLGAHRAPLQFHPSRVENNPAV